jgi:ABC-2 type transport system permease protein
MKSLSRIFAILLKEVRQLRRDRLTFGMVVGLPVMQMLLFGYAINTDVRDLKTAIADQSNTHLSRQFVAELAQTQVVNIVASVESAQQLETLLRDGSISIGVHIPHDFDRRIVDRTRTASHLLVDGSDPTILGVANQLRAMPFGDRSTAVLQSGAADAGQYRARTHGRDTYNDNDPVHGRRYRPRARARQSRVTH